MIPKKLLDEIERWIKERKFGNLQINFQEGRIVNVNKTESIRMEMLNGSATMTSVTTSEI